MKIITDHPIEKKWTIKLIMSPLVSVNQFFDILSFNSQIANRNKYDLILDKSIKTTIIYFRQLNVDEIFDNETFNLIKSKTNIFLRFFPLEINDFITISKTLNVDLLQLIKKTSVLTLTPGQLYEVFHSYNCTQIMSYLKNFKPIKYKVPEIYKEFATELSCKFFDLLLRFIAGSLSSNYFIKYRKNDIVPQIEILVSSDNKNIARNIHELTWQTLSQLFLIYLKEYIDMSIYLNCYKFEREFIERLRAAKIKEYETKIVRLKSTIRLFKQLNRLERKIDRL